MGELRFEETKRPPKSPWVKVSFPSKESQQQVEFLLMSEQEYEVKVVVKWKVLKEQTSWRVCDLEDE